MKVRFKVSSLKFVRFFVKSGDFIGSRKSEKLRGSLKVKRPSRSTRRKVNTSQIPLSNWHLRKTPSNEELFLLIRFRLHYTVTVDRIEYASAQLNCFSNDSSFIRCENGERLRLHPDFKPHAFGNCVVFCGQESHRPSQVRRCPYAYSSSRTKNAISYEKIRIVNGFNPGVIIIK